MSQNKKKWSIVVKHTHYIKTPDKGEVCGNSILLLNAYELLHHQWIGVDEFFRRFTHLFGDVVHHDDFPAINKALRSGLTAYADVLQLSNRHHYPHELLKAFLAGCFAESNNVCRYVVIDIANGDRWSLSHETPLSIWRFNRATMVVEEDNVDPKIFLRQLYDKTVPKNMRLAMRRFDHEAAIMVGDLDYRD